MKKVLILYTSVGLGHKSIAENIAHHLAHRGYAVRHADILRLQEGAWVRFGTGLHRWLNKHAPLILKFLYRYGYVIFSRLRTVVASKNYYETKELIDEYQPDVVITTQTSASAVVAYLKRQGLYRGKFAIAFSDYHFHPYWIYPEADLYFTNISEQEREMTKRGIKKERIILSGITLPPREVLDQALIRSRLGISVDAKVVLFSSGSLGISFDPTWLVKEVEKTATNTNTYVLIVCGKNTTLHETLLKTKLPPSIHIFGFYNSMTELYGIADIMVGKAGGLTLAETWQMKLPVIVTHYLPGQEELNYLYAKDKELIIPGIENNKPLPSEKLQSRITDELSTGVFKQSLITNPNLVFLIQDNLQNSPVGEAIDRLF